jgi:hypothetical protein
MGHLLDHLLNETVVFVASDALVVIFGVDVLHDDTWLLICSRHSRFYRRCRICSFHWVWVPTE